MTEESDEGQRPRSTPEELGPSIFNYDDLTPARFLHYLQQLKIVLDLQPASLLEVGPGDHTVSDVLSRRGVNVDTLDVVPELKPTYIRDIREPLDLPRRYDVVLASEVLEHMPYDRFVDTARNLVTAVAPEGALVISLPWTTIRLLPPNGRYGRVISPDGRVRTRIPIGVLQRLVRRYRFGTPARDDIFVHHWDAAGVETSRRKIRRDLARAFTIEIERAFDDTNSVFYVLRDARR